ncbi:MAG: TetR/AcrR family transcriptional regulator [Armatimonadetes bacterium]|nr:TetR/AcrR family transcriptional regulator [Armatimonadota bacterium]
MSQALYVQSRSKLTRDKLLAALARLLESHDLDSISIKDITAEAGCSVGAFYTHFQDKQQMLGELYQAYVTERGGLTGSFLRPDQWSGLSLAGVVAKLVSLTLAEYDQRGGLFRAFRAYREQLSAQDERDHMSLLYQGVQEILAPRLTHLENPTQAADFAFFAITSVGQAALVDRGRHADYLQLDRQTVQAQLVKMIVAYLGEPTE